MQRAKCRIRDKGRGKRGYKIKFLQNNINPSSHKSA
jgi:hypothetical protein